MREFVEFFYLMGEVVRPLISIGIENYGFRIGRGCVMLNLFPLTDPSFGLNFGPKKLISHMVYLKKSGCSYGWRRIERKLSNTIILNLTAKETN